VHQEPNINRSEEEKGKRKDQQSFFFPSLPTSVTATTVDGNGGADLFARGKGLGLWLGDCQSLALDFRPRK
jgi:hypothetical protein